MLESSPTASRTGGSFVFGRTLWRAWSGPAATRSAAALAVFGVGLLFLEGAATLEVRYTIRVSYVLLAAGSVVGLPAVVHGWGVVPPAVRWTALALLLAYVAAAAVNDAAILVGQERAGAHRQVVYLIDLAVGLAAVGLIVGCWSGDRDRRYLLGALIAGATAAAVYGVYQWPAQHFGWPLSDVNNALNTTGLTHGSASSGAGLLGWARIRSTFREPHLLATYLAAVLPIAVIVLLWSVRQARRFGAVAAAVIAMALALSLSASAWAVLAVSCLMALCFLAISRHWVWLAAATAAATAVISLLALLALAQPQRLSNLTGRDAVSLTISTRSRTDAWSAAVATWGSRPVLGHGPGQSAVQLAGATTKQVTGSPSHGTVLGSAHSVPMAALVDAGVLGFSFWLMFLAGVVIVGCQAVLRKSSPLMAAVLAGCFVSILSGFVAGDRFETSAWVMIGLLLALASSRSLVARSQTA